MRFFEKSKQFTIFSTYADTLECLLQDDACIAIDISPNCDKNALRNRRDRPGLNKFALVTLAS